MKIAIITHEKPGGAKSPVMAELESELASRGAEVTTIDPETTAIDLDGTTASHDLYVLKSGTPAAIALGAILHETGAHIINPYPAFARMRDKVTATKVLQLAGLPQPRTYLATEPLQLGAALDEGPIIVKPQRGSQGRGVTIVRSREELAALPNDADLLFAQEYREPDGRDHKLYRIGKQTFGVRRVFPARTYEDKLGEPFEVTGELAQMADACSLAFGVDLFGLDVITAGGEPIVVDVNTFPGFKGVPRAGALLAEYLHAACVNS